MPWATRLTIRYFLYALVLPLGLLVVIVAVPCFLWRYSHKVSDAAMSKAGRGMTRQQVERVLRDWTPETRETDHSGSELKKDPWLSQNFPGYSIVRYYKGGIKGALTDAYVDVYYDGKGRVIRSNCNN